MEPLAIPNNPVELAELCEQLWTSYFLEPKAGVMKEYNQAAAAYNTMTGGHIMAILTRNTKDNVTGVEDVVFAEEPKLYIQTQKKEPRAPKEKGKDIPNLDFKPRFMEVTDKIKELVTAEISGADKIRGAFLENPDKFNIDDFVNLSGINRSRVVGCLQKFDLYVQFTQARGASL